MAYSAIPPDLRPKKKPAPKRAPVVSPEREVKGLRVRLGVLEAGHVVLRDGRRISDVAVRPAGSGPSPNTLGS